MPETLTCATCGTPGPRIEVGCARCGRPDPIVTLADGGRRALVCPACVPGVLVEIAQRGGILVFANPAARAAA